MCAILRFVYMFKKISIRPSKHHRSVLPKNIDKIKVVKKAKDSVIHKSYTMKLSKTMEARERKGVATEMKPLMSEERETVAVIEKEDLENIGEVKAKSSRGVSCNSKDEEFSMV